MRQVLEYVTDGETLFEAVYDVHESEDQLNSGCVGPVGPLGDRRSLAGEEPVIPGRTWRYVREMVDARSDYAVDDEDLFVVHNTTWPVRLAA